MNRSETQSQTNISYADSVLICIDIQPRKRIIWTTHNILPEYIQEGFTLAELNQAITHFHEVMLPNAVKVAEFARDRKIPRIFVHWAPGAGAIEILEDQPRPHNAFDIYEDDFVIPKTEMDAFPSSNIDQTLDKLARRTLIMIGGHTMGCLGQTAKSAIKKGYTCVLVEDATFDCSQERWPKGIAEVPYHRIVTTEQLLKMNGG